MHYCKGSSSNPPLGPRKSSRLDTCAYSAIVHILGHFDPTLLPAREVVVN